MPLPFSLEGLIVSAMSTSPSILSVRMKDGFHSISFEKISVLDLYFIHRYIIIKILVKFDFIG